jgi:hypothetical protein
MEEELPYWPEAGWLTEIDVRSSKYPVKWVVMVSFDDNWIFEKVNNHNNN